MTTTRTHPLSPIARRMRLPLVAVMAALITSAGCASAPAPGERAAGQPPLRILLTNDDGYLSPGIAALHEAFRAAGYQVTLVAPSRNRSGASSSMTTSGTLRVEQVEPDVWSVDGTPADAVRVGLEYVLRGDPPDLVVSGANFGQNIGPSTLHSGTVGAALTAMQQGVPAIAMSVGIDPAEMRADPPFASTLAAFDDAAALAVRIIDRLDLYRARDGALLPPWTAINVNHPALETPALAGVAWAHIGRAEGFHIGYAPVAGEPGVLRLVFGRSDARETIPAADTTLFSEGFVTLTVLDGDLEAPPPDTDSIAVRLGDLMPEPEAP